MSWRVRSAIAMLALLAVGTALVSVLPSPDDVRNRPFEHRGVVGQDVSTRRGTYQVVQVQGSRSVTWSDTAATNTTTGLLLVITIWYAGIEEPTTIGTPQIQDASGRLYVGSTVLGSNCSLGQPLLGETCEVAIEVSPDALAGAQLRIPAEQYSDGDYDEVAVIDLGITQSQVPGWVNGPGLTFGDPRPGRP